MKKTCFWQNPLWPLEIKAICDHIIISKTTLYSILVLGHNLCSLQMQVLFLDNFSHRRSACLRRRNPSFRVSRIFAFASSPCHVLSRENWSACWWRAEFWSKACLLQLVAEINTQVATFRDLLIHVGHQTKDGPEMRERIRKLRRQCVEAFKHSVQLVLPQIKRYHFFRYINKYFNHINFLNVITILYYKQKFVKL